LDRSRLSASDPKVDTAHLRCGGLMSEALFLCANNAHPDFTDDIKIGSIGLNHEKTRRSSWMATGSTSGRGKSSRKGIASIGAIRDNIQRPRRRPCETPHLISQRASFGSEADIRGRVAHIRFTPESGHSPVALRCSLIADIRLRSFGQPFGVGCRRLRELSRVI
jgi:hypothetical protein